jgi:hypothetical protein
MEGYKAEHPHSRGGSAGDYTDKKGEQMALTRLPNRNGLLK